jgi:transcriptional regulator with XRE-family HTH domain
MPQADDSAQPFALWLRTALKSAAMSQEDLANTGVATSGTVSKWANGRIVPTDLETVIAIAHATGQTDSVLALEAAGLTHTADLIRKAIAAAAADPMLVKIRNDRTIGAQARTDIEEAYRRRQADTIHDFELRLADARRRARLERTGRSHPEPQDNGAGQAAL